ncbi:M48 family metallopeptidase [Vibrio anguillarum]|uniref:M48 metallopeptidase family protein n=1 Tax=Vibrio TaxID=662 RepID=UPI00097E3A52|nr:MULTISPECIES: M48 family metallopeptidase [Vibrio]MBF4283447.1 M48 family peptidase [Vibrio anguillarum]MBF4288068.1 M48 family peptidase [Vibrio anguillarum]MBF4340081.1 M48 family peptidase [Vibrio anguillarum]MBF4355386.1 M48 family peptidase [Vibrio anguillarum]MBF4377552.1 M48 family peptidase [Vibrio anguillarum]
MHPSFRYIQNYPPHLVSQVEQLITAGKFVSWFEQRYPQRHSIQSEKALFNYAIDLKNQYMKKTAPISKVVYDNKIHIINNALGLHSYVAKVHGGKIKSKNEIRIASMFKEAPEPLLRMLVVHELAHIKEKEHNKAFYQLCCHMEPNYHQLEFDARLFMMYLDLKEDQ